MAGKISNSSERLKEMMSELSLKQSDVVARTGVTKSALSNYLHGTREPRQDQISKIADPYKINPSWLMGYDVPMYINKEVTFSSLSEIEVLLVNTYRNSSEDEQKMITNILAYIESKHST